MYVFREGTFVPSVRPPSCRPLDPWPCPLALPVDWHVTGSVTADVTGDGAPECVLLVWRPWQDWPTQRWSPIASPIETFHDAAGDSCHLILLDPATGREVWAGSALPAPLLALAVGDMDGDEQREVVTLEGSYAGGRAGVASHVDVWRWNGFGFTLMWRSPPGAYRALCLEDVDGDGVLDIAVH
ncbi:MAG: VCBS repeat-containing protein [Anaerolineae bacterium]|nr:VCBS repeat-containing protein [Anaerolineae bacterium]